MESCCQATVHHSGAPKLRPSLSWDFVEWCYSSDKIILMWQLRLRMRPEVPRALGAMRRRVEAVCGAASFMCKRSGLRVWCSFFFSFEALAFAVAAFCRL